MPGLVARDGRAFSGRAAADLQGAPTTRSSESRNSGSPISMNRPTISARWDDFSTHASAVPPRNRWSPQLTNSTRTRSRDSDLPPRICRTSCTHARDAFQHHHRQEYNALTGAKVRLGRWDEYLAMRTGVLAMNVTYRDLLSNDLGAIAGLLFDVGSGRYTAPRTDDARAQGMGAYAGPRLVAPPRSRARLRCLDRVE